MLDQIKIAFADIDKKMHEDQMAWAMGRVDALREFDPKKTERYLEAEAKPKEEFYEGRKQDTLIHIYWDEKYNLAGGKTWYGIFYGRSKDDVADYIVKNVEALIEKRNARIVAALTKKGITEIPAFEIKHNGEGYEGEFQIGDHLVTITTILAGGYHIQCLHQRTLVNVKAAA